MKRDWVNECITGERPVQKESASKASAGVLSVLGERAERPPEPDANTRPPSIPAETEQAPEAAAPTPEAPEGAEPEEQGVPAESDVASLVTAWQSGSQMAVAQRVLDGLPSYRDFVSLVYQIGQEGALQLAATMDELSASAEGEDESPVLPPSREPAGDENAVIGADDQPPV